MKKELIELFGDHIAFSIEGAYAEHYQQDQEINPASVIKLSVLYGALRQVDENKLDINHMVAYGDEDIVPGCGSLQNLSLRQMSFKDLLMLMITNSDNTATNILMDHVGLDYINHSIQFLGLKHTHVRRKLYHMIPGVFNAASTYDTNLLLKAFDQGIGLSEQAQALGMYILSKQALNNLTKSLSYCPICGHINTSNTCPDHPDTESLEVEFYSKSGEIEGHVHDAAILKHGGQVIYVTLFTYDQADNAETKHRFRKVGQLLYNKLKEIPC